MQISNVLFVYFPIKFVVTSFVVTTFKIDAESFSVQVYLDKVSMGNISISHPLNMLKMVGDGRMLQSGRSFATFRYLHCCWLFFLQKAAMYL